MSDRRSDPPYIRAVSGVKYAVFRGSERLTTPTVSFDRVQAELKQAERRLAAERARGVQTRPCLICKAPFPSEGAHHRLCPSCRHQPLGKEFQ